MNTNRISVRYAKALFQTALELNVAEAVDNDMRLISKTLVTTEFRNFLENPVVFPSKKQKVFNSIYKDSVNELTIKFLKLLTDKKRELYLRAIARNYSDFYRKHFGIKSVELVTAFTADKKLKDDIIKIIEKTFSTKVELSDRSDPDIIGGFVLSVEGMQYDASISTKLKEIKRELL